MRGAFLVLARHDDASALTAAAASLAPMLEKGGWRCVRSGDWAIALVRSAADLPTRPILDDLGIVIGDLFPRHDGVAPPRTGADEQAFERQCGRLSGDYWGRYVAIRWPTQTIAAAAFRDPSGALDCLTWAASGLTLIGSELPKDLPPALRPKLSPDWDAVGAILADPTRSAGALALSGARAVWPGELWFDDGAPSSQVWTPRRFASPSTRSDEALQQELVSRVDACVGAWLPPSSGALIEVSGGLDSAIVATAAARVDTPGPRVWLNYRASNPRSDERVFARAVGALEGFDLSEATKAGGRLDLSAWRALSDAVRPPLCALDPARDRDVAARCAAASLARTLTGQGGDIVFFQMPTQQVVADLAQSGATMIDILRAAHGVARWTGQSAWRGLFQAIVPRLGRTGSSAPWPVLTERALAAGRACIHPWLDGLDDLPPGKRLQIEGLAACVSFHGDSHAARAALVVHPLLSQPVVELCLQIPTFQLTRCRRDRAFAREAFAARLPPIITDRRGKGEVSSHYGRLLAASLDDLRPLLLDGELVRHGLLDRARLEPLLTPESLVLNGSSYALTSAALLETWVSGWSGQI